MEVGNNYFSMVEQSSLELDNMVRNNFLDLDHMDQGMDLVGNMAMGGNTLEDTLVD